jgi:isoquinoline 1-oxidoreductase
LWTIVLPPTDGRSWGWSTPGGITLTIDGTGRITGYTGKVEAGQGNRASLTRTVAAELGVPTDLVSIEMGDTATTPYDYGTVGSRSTPDAGHGLRLVAVAARRELVAAAARRWEIAPDDLLVQGGVVRVPGGGPEIAFGDLVEGDRTVTVDPDEALPAAVTGLSDVDDATLRRYLGTVALGAKRFPSDLAVPGMHHGRILRAPGYGATLVALDDSVAAEQADLTVVRDGDFVGVVAATPSAADAALERLRARWSVPEQPDDAELEAYLRAHPADIQGWGGPVAREAGDVEAGYAGADVRLAATYTAAYIAHVPMEPRVALAEVGSDGATVWVGTQRPFAVRDDVARALDLAPEQVRVVVPDFGGGFGGKHSSDVAVEAARLARAAGVPVRVAWTREEEFRWAYFRPAAVIDVRSGATAGGALTAWEFTNVNSGAAALFTPYQCANRTERFVPAASPLPQGSYRALAATANCFARESHMDELAYALETDPVALRRGLLRDARLRDVLDVLAKHIGWPGSHFGIACEVEKECRVATAAEVKVDGDGTLNLVRLVTAVDVGAVVDPSGLRNQVIGATVMGLGGALFEGIRFGGGRVLNASLAGYRVPRFGDIPPIEVLIVDRPDLPSAGGGETPIVTVAPAIANAIHAVTGKRLRSLPLAPDGIVH